MFTEKFICEMYINDIVTILNEKNSNTYKIIVLCD